MGAFFPGASYQIPGYYGIPQYKVSFEDEKYTIGNFKGTIPEIVKNIFIEFTQSSKVEGTDFVFIYPFCIDENLKVLLSKNGNDDEGFPQNINREELLKEINQEFERYLHLLPFI